MAADYTWAKDLATELLAEFGATVTLRRRATGAYNPDFGVKTVATAALSTAISASVATIPITGESSAWPTSGSFVAEEEEITYTAKSGATITGVARGVEGTTTSIHASGTSLGLLPGYVDYDVTGVVSNFDQRLFLTNEIEYGDQLVLVSAQDLAVTPTLEDKIVLSGQEWTIVYIEKIAPSQDDIMYEIQIKQ